VLLLGPAARTQAAALPQRRQQQPAGEPEHVVSATVLGVPVGVQSLRADGGSAAFEERLPGVLTALARLSHIKALSAFGRGLGSAAYGIARLLYSAEFDDVPSVAQCKVLEQAVAKLIDRGMAPDAEGRAFAGVKASLLAGRPADGGFGMLPWRQHIIARHAWWGAQLLTAPADTTLPWVQLGRAMLSAALPAALSWPGPLCFIHDVFLAASGGPGFVASCGGAGADGVLAPCARAVVC
jgi:hypothetical protein